MNIRNLFLAGLALSTAAFAQSLPGPVALGPAGPGNVAEADGVYQLRYFSNLQAADSYVDATNAGTFNGIDPDGRICANFYAFDYREELVACCACLVTPNGLISLSARNDLLALTLTGSTVPFTNGITVKVLSSLPIPVGGTVCNPATPNAGNLVRGLKVWGTTSHINTALPALPQPQMLTETQFANAELSATELAKLTGFCRFIQVVASGFGICRSCPTLGAQGAEIR